MSSIHLVERENRVHKPDKEKNEWESGYWSVSEATAQKLIGGYIYLHRKQAESSHFGGEILGFRVQSLGEWVGRIVFRFRFAMEFKGVRTDSEGWSNEMKIVWQTTQTPRTQSTTDGTAKKIVNQLMPKALTTQSITERAEKETHLAADAPRSN